MIRVADARKTSLKGRDPDAGLVGEDFAHQGAAGFNRVQAPARQTWSGLLVAILVLGGPGEGFGAPAKAPTLAALTGDGTLLVFSADRPGEVRRTGITGVRGTLVGIDRRPKNGLLYGVTTASDVYTVDPDTGAGTLVSTLTVPFDGDSRSGV